MSYTERMRTLSEKPSCWGDPGSYSPNDDECEDCRAQHTCRAEVERRDGYRRNPSYSVPTSRVTERRPYAPPSRDREHRDRDEIERVDWAPGPIHEKDDPTFRFFKDAAAGGLRGGFYEMYRFWRIFRFK